MKTSTAEQDLLGASSGYSCRSCNCKNSWQRRYCRSCGHGLTQACTTCQFANGLTDAYCGGCGDKMQCGNAPAVKPTKQVAMKQSSPTTLSATQESEPKTTKAQAQSLANRLAGLNAEKVKSRQVTPPPPPRAVGKPKDDIGQEQIDALFG